MDVDAIEQRLGNFEHLALDLLAEQWHSRVASQKNPQGQPCRRRA
jgi:hypothetical protein